MQNIAGDNTKIGQEEMRDRIPRGESAHFIRQACMYLWRTVCASQAHVYRELYVLMTKSHEKKYRHSFAKKVLPIKLFHAEIIPFT